MTYLDILVNECDDALLYINGKAYQDIDTTWVDCLLFFKDILKDEVTITLRKFQGERQDFPDNIDTNSNAFKWFSIGINEVQNYINKNTVKCELSNEILIIEPTKQLPKDLPFEALIKGKWYVLID